jgi:hypothetical protein
MKLKLGLLAIGLAAASVASAVPHTIRLNGGNPIMVAAGATVTVPYNYVRPADGAAPNFSNITAVTSSFNVPAGVSVSVSTTGNTPPANASVTCSPAAATAGATQIQCGFFTNPATAVAVGNYVLGTVTIVAGATPATLTFTSAPVECADTNGNKITGACEGANATVTIGPAGGGMSQVTLGPAAGLSFGNSNVGTATATQNLTLANTNATAGSVASCAITGAGAANFQFFPAPTFPIAIASGATVNVPVRFNPTAAGPLAAVVNCTAGAMTTITGSNIPLSGTGVAVDAAPMLTYNPAAAAAVNFPMGAAGAATTTIAITSSGAAGTGNTVLSGCTIGAGFTPAGTVSTTPANGTFNTTVTSGTINLGCTRGATAQTATLSCTETRTPTVAGSPFTRTWPLTCPAATLPAAVVTPSIASGGSTAALNITVGSTGSTSVTFANAAGGQPGGPITCTIAAPANGWTAGAATAAIPAGGNAAVSFSFAPTATGAANAVASCTGAGLAAGYTVNLIGNGVAPVVNLVTQVPSLSDLGKWLLIASLLGFGLVMVGRRQS